MAQYSFLLEFEVPEQVSKALLRATGGDIKKAQNLLYDIVRADPHAFEDMANTGKGSVTREMIRKAATQARLRGDEVLAKELEKEQGNLTNQTKKLIKKGNKAADKTLAKMQDVVDDANPVKGATSKTLQKNLDNARDQVSKGNAKLRDIHHKVLSGPESGIRKAKVADYNVARHLETVSKKGAYTQQQYEELIKKLMLQNATTKDPLVIAKNSRQIDYLASKAGLTDKLEQLRNSLSDTYYSLTNAANNISKKEARDVGRIARNLRSIDNYTRIVRDMERSVPPKSSSSIISTIRGWAPKLRRLIKK